MKDQKSCYLHSASKVMRRTHVNMNLSSLQVVNHHFTVNCHFTLVNHCFTVNHEFTLVNHHFTVYCQFTLVNHCFTVNCHFTVICQFTVIHQFTAIHWFTVKQQFTVNHFERPLAEDSNFFPFLFLESFGMNVVPLIYLINNRAFVNLVS